jgi:hypothetical protein
MAELSDAEVFGGAPTEMSDADVFGMPPTFMQNVGRGLGLGTRDVIEGTLGGPYDAIAAGLNKTGLLPPINTLGENLTKLGLPEPKTPFERTVSGVDQPIASTLLPMSVGTRLATSASPVVSAVGNALTAQPATQATAAAAGGLATEATGDPRIGTAVSVAGPLLMHGAGVTGRAIENTAIGGISKPDAELGKLALDKYKIPIGAPDLTDNTLLRIGADQAGKLPFSGAGPAAAAKQAAWQGAIAREMGEPTATSFTPDVMAGTKARLGQAFDDAAANTSIPPAETSTLSNGLANIMPEASQVLTDAELKPLQTQIDNINGLIAKGNGTLSGEAYQALTRSKAPLDLAEGSTNPNVAHYASMIRDHLDDAFQRSASPDVQDALSQARYQYRVMRTIDPLVAGSRDGNITPDAFMQKVLTASRRFDAPTGGMAYTGGGNIGELARIGKLMRAPPQTGTADRMLINAAAVGGTGLPALVTHPATMVGVPAGLMANRLLGMYLRSGGTANRLIDAVAPDLTRPNPLLTALQTSGVTALTNQIGPRNRLGPRASP